MQDRQYDIITNKMDNFMHIMFFTMRRRGFSTKATQWRAEDANLVCFSYSQREWWESVFM